jgi:outer membrane protein
MFLAVGLALSALPAHAETLADALIAAYRNSNLLEQNRAVLRAADEDVALRVAALRPVLDFVARGQWQRGYNSLLGAHVESTSLNLGLSAEITLLDGGGNRLALAAAEESVRATRQALVGVESRVLLGAVQAYMGMREAHERIALRQGNVRVIQRELDAARDRFELGEITRTDVAIAESRLAAARAQLAQAEGELAIARETFTLAVGRKPGQLAAPPRAPATAPSLDQAKAIARKRHHDIIRAQHDLAAAELNMQRTEASTKPRLSASGSIGLDKDGRDNQSLSLTLSQRLYSGGSLSALYRQAMARRDAQRSGLHQTVAAVEQAVGEAWARREIARASIAAGDRRITAARTAYDGVREEAKLGARTTLDVLNAEQELLDAQASRVTAAVQEYTATYALLAAMGLLTVDHLKLGIPTYDVDSYYNAVRNAPATSTRGKKLDQVLQAIGRGN